MNIQTISHEGRFFQYVDTLITIPAHVTAQMIDQLSVWQKLHPPEETFAHSQYGTPTLIARFDGVLAEDGKEFLSYEIQDTCGGLGYGGLVWEELRRARDHFKNEKWLPFSLLAGRGNKNHDDHLWLKQVTLKEAMAGSMLLLIRLKLKQRIPASMHAYEHLVPRSICPLKTRGDKRYGVEMGWWKTVDWSGTQEGESLPWDTNFAIKPVQGSGARDVFMWTVNKKEGGTTRTQIKEALQRRGHMFLQPFISPMRMSLRGQPHNLVFGPFFGWGAPTKK